MRLLVVEDDADIRRYYESALRKSSIDCDVAESKTEAIDLLKRRSYEGAIIDLQLSDDTTYAPGKAVLAYANANGEGTICFVVSGSPDPDDILDTWKGGAHTFIRKSTKTFQEIALDVAQQVRSNKLKPFGKFGSLNVYLSHPTMAHDWESLLNQTIGCGFDKMQQAISNSFGPILPVLRHLNKVDALEFQQASRRAEGVFWSKGLGAAVRITLSASEEDLSKMAPETIVRTGRVGTAVYYSVVRLPEVDRGEFVEFVDETPWK